jgi:hypothetical protein
MGGGMMKFIKLENQEQFDRLTRKNIVIVKWREGTYNWKHGEVQSYKNTFIVKRLNELIVNQPKNTYLNISMYLNGESTAEEVYVISP